MSAIHIPNQQPFKWEPVYIGPPSEAYQDASQSLSGTAIDVDTPMIDLSLPSQEDMEDEAAVVQLLFPRRSKVRVIPCNDRQDACILIPPPT